MLGSAQHLYGVPCSSRPSVETLWLRRVHRLRACFLEGLACEVGLLHSCLAWWPLQSDFETLELHRLQVDV